MRKEAASWLNCAHEVMSEAGGLGAEVAELRTSHAPSDQGLKVIYN